MIGKSADVTEGATTRLGSEIVALDNDVADIVVFLKLWTESYPPRDTWPRGAKGWAGFVLLD
jgi:hypothetical protein